MSEVLSCPTLSNVQGSSSSFGLNVLLLESDSVVPSSDCRGTAFERSRMNKKRLPKFDGVGWLITGALVSLLLLAFNLWEVLTQPAAPFVPMQAGRLLGIGVGLVLAIHCFDMIGYYRKHGRLK
jgi:hypothetical protein